MSAIVVVDKEDRVVGSRERDALLPGDIYRVSALWLTNPVGDVLLAKRSHTKKKNPGAWGPAVAGTVEQGEDHMANILKEASEELSLALAPNDLVVGPKIYVHGIDNDYFAQYYLHTTHKQIDDFSLQPDEVEKVEWFKPLELKRLISDKELPFTSASGQWVELFLK